MKYYIWQKLKFLKNYDGKWKWTICYVAKLTEDWKPSSVETDWSFGWWKDVSSSYSPVSDRPKYWAVSRYIWWRETFEDEKKKPVRHTYTTTHTRSDGVEFTEGSIDGEDIEDFKKRLEKSKVEIKKMNWLLTSHRNLFSK